MTTVTCNSKRLLSENEKKKKKQKLTSFALLFFPTSICDSEEHHVGEEKSRVVARKCLKPSERSFIKAGRSVHLVTTKSLTVSSIQSSFFRTGVPDWHNNKSNNKISVTCKNSHSDPSSHTHPCTTLQCKYLWRYKHESRQASAWCRLTEANWVN